MQRPFTLHSAVFATKHLIVREARWLRARKLEVYPLPYSSINIWSSENACSMLDFTGELELWTHSGKWISVGKQVDVRWLDMLIAMCVLGE